MADPSFGLWPPGGGGGGGGNTTPVGIVRLRLGSGTEAIDGQIGNVVTGITVNADGDYELAIDPAYDTGTFYWVLGAGDFVARIVVLFPTGPTMALNVYDAAGVHAPIGRLCIAFYSDAA